MESKYKVGDRVRLTEDNNGFGNKGDTGSIVKCNKNNAYVRFDTFESYGDHDWFINYDRLELAVPAISPGGRIRLKRHYGFSAAGDEGTVTAVADDFVGALMDFKPFWGMGFGAFPVGIVERAEAKAEAAADCAVRKEQPGNTETLTLKVEVDHASLGRAIADIRAAQDAPAIVALTKNGKPLPSRWPHVHASTDLATQEAERLARANPGQEFAVYQRVTARVCAVSYEMKEMA